MKDMHANSNESMVFKLVVSLEQGGKNEHLESPLRLWLICFKTFRLKFHFKPATYICCSVDTWYT